MAQEFQINSSAIESKINQLLPSQGGFGAGVDFSASTMVIPIVDLTETAEGSDVRADLQTALSHTSVSTFSVQNATTTIISTTGYFRIFGTFSGNNDAASVVGEIKLFDGSTRKIIQYFASFNKANENTVIVPFDFIVFLKAGDTVEVVASVDAYLVGCSRQIADISGNLVNPL